MKWPINTMGCFVIALMIVCAGSALSAEAPSLDSTDAAPDTGKATGFAGPSSVAGTIQKDDDARAAKPTRLFPTEKHFSFKQRIEDDYGFSFGFDYSALYQASTNSPGEDSAAGGVFRAYGHWILVNRGKNTAGMFVYKVENRHRLGTDTAPKDLGFESGYAGLTAVPFSDIGWALTNFYWSQHLLNNRVGFVAGVVDTTDYVDVYGLVNPLTDFNNLAFSTNPTIPAPDQGLGTAVCFMATDNYYILGGISDANGHPTEPGELFESFFDDAEFFTHLEIGWISSWAQRFNDNIHLTFWHADEREHAQVSDGWGAAFSFSQLFGETWEPFFRAGYADEGGALWERSVSAGLGYHIQKRSAVLGAGLNWGRPSEDTLGADLNDQYTAEIYFRWQPLKILTITPDAQVIFDPALNPGENMIAVFGIRARINL